LFFESGPQRTRLAVCAYLRQQVEAGRLRIPADQQPYAAVQLLNMAVGMYQMQMWLGLLVRVDESELSPHLERVVDDFLKLYQAEP
jgi:hypothetical protein